MTGVALAPRLVGVRDGDGFLFAGENHVPVEVSGTGLEGGREGGREGGEGRKEEKEGGGEGGREGGREGREGRKRRREGEREGGREEREGGREEWRTCAGSTPLVCAVRTRVVPLSLKQSARAWPQRSMSPTSTRWLIKLFT